MRGHVLIHQGFRPLPYDDSDSQGVLPGSWPVGRHRAWATTPQAIQARLSLPQRRHASRRVRKKRRMPMETANPLPEPRQLRNNLLL